jgi:O-acetylserine/cysteine efflux transporter
LLVIAHGAGGEVSLPGFLCVLGAAAAWGAANVFSKRRLAEVPPLTLVAWGNLYAALPMFLLSAAVEGLHSWAVAADQVGLTTAAALAYIVYPTSLLGHGVWASQLRRHPAAMVAPYSLSVPAFGLLGGSWLLGEPMQRWKLAAAALVFLGLGVNQFGHALLKRLEQARV